MLRNALLVFAAFVLLLGVAFSLAGKPDGPAVAFWGGLLLIAVLLERWRYRSTHGPLSAEWEKTGERFVDPESGVTMQVFYNPRSGERRYEKSS